MSLSILELCFYIVSKKGIRILQIIHILLVTRHFPPVDNVDGLLSKLFYITLFQPYLCITLWICVINFPQLILI